MVNETHTMFDFADLNGWVLEHRNNQLTTSNYIHLSTDEYLLTETGFYNNSWIKAKTDAINSEVLYFEDAPNVLHAEYLKK